MKLKVRIVAWYIAKRLPKEAEKMFGKNWKTSLGGLGMILTGLAAIVHCFTCKDCGSTMECLVAGIGGVLGGGGLLFAKDHNVSGGDVPQTKVAAELMGMPADDLPGPEIPDTLVGDTGAKGAKGDTGAKGLTGGKR